MVSGGSKRIVVIKDIPSNFIEEAIFILKGEDSKSKVVRTKNDYREGATVNQQVKPQNNDYIIKEAQIIIDSYINENKLQAETRRKQYQKQNILTKVFSLNMIINTTLIASIVLLFLLAFKVF